MPSSTPVSELTADEAEAELRALREEIARHDIAYHQKDAPLISDAEYDALRRRNTELEERFPELVQPDGPSSTVGAAPAEGFAKVRHQVPMLSLANAFSDEDVAEFVGRGRKFFDRDKGLELFFTAEPKIDGLSASLRYERGVFVRGATRGDGYVGEDITENLKTIADIPHRLKGEGWPDLIEIRGEVYMTHAEFRALNKKASAEGKPLYVNPRNTAAGSLRQLDVSITASRNLKFFAYAWGYASSPPAPTQYEAVQNFSRWGLAINPLMIRTDSVEVLLQHYRSIEAQRSSLGYDIDGVVYKLDRLDLQERWGFVSRAPRWAIAHKFSPEQASTLLHKIDIQVGRTGTLTPVARLAPITVGGVVVENATLHNEDYIAGRDSFGQPIRDGLDIREGDTVVVQRAGDVIPQIIAVVADKRPPDSVPYEFPTRCPVCNSPAERELNEKTGKLDARRRCTGELICPAQAIEALRHFVGRDAMDIEGLGTEQIELFFEQKLIANPADIFALPEKAEAVRSALYLRREQQASERELKTGVKRKKILSVAERDFKGVEKLFAAIEGARRPELDRFIFALGIRHVGETTAALFAKTFGTFEAFRTAAEAAARHQGDLHDVFPSINGVGETSLRSVLSFFANERNGQVLDALLRKVSPQPYEVAVSTESQVAGKTVVFTGSLEKMTRSEAKAMAERNGAKVAGSVSANTDILVAGPGAGSKLKRAEELGITVVDEDGWFALINR